MYSPFPLIDEYHLTDEEETQVQLSSNDFQDNYTILENLRENEKGKLDEKIISKEVSRDNVYYDVINLYRKRNTSSHLLRLIFKDGDTVGDGVCIVVYSILLFASKYI